MRLYFPSNCNFFYTDKKSTWTTLIILNVCKTIITASHRHCLMQIFEFALKKIIIQKKMYYADDDTYFTMSFFLVLNFERHRSVFYTGVLRENKELQWRYQAPPCFKLVGFLVILNCCCCLVICIWMNKLSLIPQQVFFFI